MHALDKHHHSLVVQPAYYYSQNHNQNDDPKDFVVVDPHDRNATTSHDNVVCPPIG
jgi:hypothetical protein